jgi:hypothetical protein
MRTYELACEEVKKLKAAIAELDRSMGWGGGQGMDLESLDTTGALPWHPVGQGSRPATSPVRQARHREGGNGCCGWAAPGVMLQEHACACMPR